MQQARELHLAINFNATSSSMKHQNPSAKKHQVNSTRILNSEIHAKYKFSHYKLNSPCIMQTLHLPESKVKALVGPIFAWIFSLFKPFDPIYSSKTSTTHC